MCTVYLIYHWIKEPLEAFRKDAISRQWKDYIVSVIIHVALVIQILNTAFALEGCRKTQNIH